MSTDTKIVEVRLPLDRSMPVLGYVTDVPGLVVTPRASTHRVINDEFTVTHEASGWGVLRTFYFNSVEVARICASEIKGEFDWTLDREEFETQMAEIDRDELYSRLLAIAESVQLRVESDPIKHLGIKVDAGD